MNWSFLEKNSSSYLINCQENAALFQKFFDEYFHFAK